MKNILFYIGDDVSVSPLLIILSANAILSLLVAFQFAKSRVIGFWRSFIAGLVLSAAGAFIMIQLYQTKKEKQAETDIITKYSGSKTITSYLRKLKLLQQTGLISKKEYEEEINQLLNQ